MKSEDKKNLKKRYLIWFYKSVKEALDKIERKFTQVDIDRYILDELKRLDKDKVASPFISDFKEYIQKKESNGIKLKFENNKLRPEYLFLTLKLKAIERSICKELGNKALKQIKDLYEKEMIKRIIEERELKV